MPINKKDMKDLFSFIDSQKLCVLATFDKDVWASNVFYGIDPNFTIYFVSSENKKHSMQILKNPKIAFSISWFNKSDHTDRKAVQGQGICEIAKTDEEIKKGIKLHNKRFPEFAKRITYEWIKTNKTKSRIWTIKPFYIKYWDDKLYGQDGTKEFIF